MSGGTDNDRWVRPGRATGREVVVIQPGDDGQWSHTGLVVVRLDPGEQYEFCSPATECVVVPLHGAVRATCDDADIALSGRDSVFDGPTDVAYLPDATSIEVSAGEGPARVALCLASRSSDDAFPARGIDASDVPIELRGAGVCSREVRGLGMPGTLDAEGILVCEVITPAGNWSSYPPHKHDEARDGVETELEEIYYFEARHATGGRDHDAIGYHRVYGTADRPIDVLAEVRTGDAVMVPHGWHGPSMAAPDADLYYLNVMAGPGPERNWLISDDPAHAAIRDGWAGLPVDPRLPMGGER
ncbi:5-deoxy-glucuronate isomerase [Flexivirga oryzae]|uniref:5-deoxy-glucuronate isomerase n=1 Tax=Flexivirga oryzae TaxID=1794944 RepID=A0A839MZR3_9MICO|nr:5-deoxy-glucuronate isomerase [Flexivirga oryzae]MBB2890079.1 5-deoxy-glucuronate isomerase [Flexivirga oryzae]